MATFIFKIDNKEIALETLPTGPVKETFQKLKKLLTTQLQSLKCEIHRNVPVVILQAKYNNVTLAGFGACCAEFGSKIRGKIKLPEANMGSDIVVTTRRLKYTEYGK